jgi:hypothetical protein
MRVATIAGWAGAALAIVIVAGSLVLPVPGAVNIGPAVAAVAVAIGAAWLVRRRPGIAGMLMVAAAPLLLYGAGALSVIPIPLLLIGAVFCFRNLPPA